MWHYFIVVVEKLLWEFEGAGEGCMFLFVQYPKVVLARISRHIAVMGVDLLFSW